MKLIKGAHLDFTKTKLSKHRKLTDYAKVQAFLSPLLRGRRSQVAKAARRGNKYLNIGCGPNVVPGFVNLDYHWRPGVDLCWDLNNGIPLPDASVDGIYTEHCLEHLSLSLCRFVLGEAFRVLRPAGVIRVIVPDAELYLDLYQRAKQGAVDFPYVPAETFKKKSITPLMAVNEMFRGHGHLFAYDFETMQKLLRDNGFSSVVRSEYGQGTPNLILDSRERRVESLYIEGTKL